MPAIRLSIVLPVLFSLLMLASCGPPAKPESQKNVADQENPESSPKDPDPSPEPKSTEEPETVADSNKGEPATESVRAITADDRETLIAFGDAYATAMSEEEGRSTQNAWDLEALLALAMGDSAANAPEAAAGIKRGFLGGAKKRPGGMMWATFGEPWRMLRVHEVDGEWRILCRANAAGGVSYIDLVPRFNDDEELKFVDAYTFATGEKLSKSLERVLLPQIAEATKIPIEKLLTKPDPLVKHIDQFISLSQAIQRDDFAGVIDQFNSLPSELQDNKTILLMYLGAAGKLMAAAESDQAEAAYRDGVERFQKQFGDDPAFLLLGIDYYFYREDFEGATEAIDKLDKAVGGDPFLDFFRASVLLVQEKYKEALPLAEKARDNNPELEEPYWGIVNIHLSLGNFAQVAEGLDQLAEKFYYEFELASDPIYADFLASPEGQKWVAKQVTEDGN